MAETDVEGNPQPEGSPAPSATDQPSADNLPELIARLNAAEKTLKDQQGVIKALQSSKDKRWDSEVKPMKTQLEKIAELLGADPSQVSKAQRELELDEIRAAWRESETQSAPESKGGEAQVELAGIAKAFGLPEDDARVSELMVKHSNDVGAFAVAAAALKTTLASPPPTPAETPLPSGGVRPEGPMSESEIREKVLGQVPGNNPFDPGYLRRMGGGISIKK